MTDGVIWLTIASHAISFPLANFGRYCTTNTQCETLSDPMYRCNTKSVNSTLIWQALGVSSNSTSGYGLCKHKALLDPFNWKDTLSFILIFIGACVAAGAGVGGGGLNVAMLNFIDGFTGTNAIPLSSVRAFSLH